jgi:micrococcal nuclease
MKRIAAIALTILLITSPAQAQSPGTVLSIGDGDTITINQNGEKVKVRLGWIDAPEMKQAPYGEAARNQLKSLLPIGIPITVREIDCDRPKP